MNTKLCRSDLKGLTSQGRCGRLTIRNDEQNLGQVERVVLLKQVSRGELPKVESQKDEAASNLSDAKLGSSSRSTE